MKNTFYIMAIVVIVMVNSLGFAADQAEKGTPFYSQGALYLDWLGFKSGDTPFFQRLSSRLKLTLWNRPGDGWTVLMDVRDRATLGEAGSNQVILYDARLSYDSQKNKLFFAIGQMNLYDTVGIGQLTGGSIGYKITKAIALGGYGGLEPDVYNSHWDTKYLKYGLFLRYLGTGAKQFALSFNRVVFNSKTERQYLYSSLLLPVKTLLVIYGNLEYELGSATKSQDKLSHLFLNARLNLSKYADVTAHYNTGRGLDFHRFLLEQSQNPSLQNLDIERYYYNQTYGVRLSATPVSNLRLFVERRESKQKDLNIHNHSNRFGLSATNIFKSGISLYGNYTLNRGDDAESNAYYLSLSRSFGKLSWNLNYANYYNGVRFIGNGTPELFHVPDQKTISSNFFLILSKALAVSVEYAYTDQTDASNHQFYLRLIYRKWK